MHEELLMRIHIVQNSEEYLIIKKKLGKFKEINGIYIILEIFKQFYY